MNATSATVDLRQLPVLLRGQTDAISGWVERSEPVRLAMYVAVIVFGSGLYGAAMGAWRAPEQALLVAVKFPLVLLVTTAGNALLNGMLAPLLGLNLSFRQSSQAILMSFVIASLVLAAFSPIVAFLVWNSPPLDDPSANAARTHAFIKLTHVLIIAFAGVAANLRLFQLLRQLAGNVRVARAVLGAWLVGNLFLGTQLTWILRPFIGAPWLPVQFLRPNAFEGNFFETVVHAVGQLLFP